MKKVSLDNILPLFVGVTGVTAWFAVLNLFHPSPIIDEETHIRVIESLAGGKWDVIRDIPMIPGFHLVAAGLSLGVDSLLLAGRLISYIAGLFSIFLVQRISQHQSESGIRWGILVIPFSPILFLYSSLAYTDTLTAFFIIAALWAKTAKKQFHPAIFLFLSCMVRQTNIVWVLFFIVWVLVEVSPKNRTEIKTWLKMTKGYWIAMLVTVCIYLWGNFTSSNLQQNQLKVNIGNIYLFFLAFFICWLPIWVEEVQGFFISAKGAVEPMVCIPKYLCLWSGPLWKRDVVIDLE